MFWRIGQFPELDHLPAQQRVKLLRAVPWWTYPMLVGRAAALGFCAAALFGLVLVNLRQPPLAVEVAVAVTCVACATGGYLYQLKQVRVHVRRGVAKALRGQRPPFCFACGYDLRGSPRQRCPECGHVIADGIGEDS